MLTVNRRLKGVYHTAPIVQFNSKSKFIIMSDCHRGKGNIGDNFQPNQPVYIGALEYYYDNGFTYIELGDGDELWENKCLKPIIEAHNDVFELLSRFYNNDRLYMLYGNHDAAKQKNSYLKSNCYSYYCDSALCQKPLFPGIEIPEGMILQDSKTKNQILLIHGHQVSFLNDTLWPLTRFFVRHVWKPLESVGFLAPAGPSWPREKAEKAERKLSSFAKQEKIMMIAGHTHHPVFAKPGNTPYFNDGSCVNPGGVTGVEIENGMISLVKWYVSSRKDRTMYIERELMAGPVNLTDYNMQ